VTVALDMLHNRLSDHLDRIRRYFKSRVKITIVVRNLDLLDGDVFIGDDDAESVIAAIRALEAKR
jgi:hypothetical protein